jgi:hypothetical protein
MNHSQGNAVLTELHYLPCIAFFVEVQSFEKIVMEVYENYPKQTYRNRCYIRTADGVQALSIPVSRGGGKKIKYKDVRISYAERWQNNHWRAIRTAYGKSPFFDFFADDYHDILYTKYKFLLDLNLALLSKCLDFLNWHNKQLILTESYVKDPDPQYVDQRGLIDLKSASPGTKGAKYSKYHQVFGKDFVPNLSVIDLLFCEGANANMILRQSSP